ASGSRPSAAAGPRSPWLSDDCGSLSKSKTRRPASASAPARLWAVVDFPTPPFMLTKLITSTVPALRRDGSPGMVSAGRTTGVQPIRGLMLGRTTGVQAGRATGVHTREVALLRCIRLKDQRKALGGGLPGRYGSDDRLTSWGRG